MKLGMDRREPKEADSLEFEEAAPQFASIASNLGAKNLLIIIVTMPFVFLVVVMAIIAIFGDSKDDAQMADGATPGAVRSTPVASLEEPALAAGRRVTLPIVASDDALPSGIVLPEGSAAGAISLDGDRLAVRVDSVDGGMIVIYDLTQNTVVQTIPLAVEDDGR